ncbi:Der GTPase-activating protein YihI [Testudinibacter sp. TR-2022]|uniref:Der GTPase-activating protein YihI n=1 Tax=Testudinibacter sp. TR-2022 TaxID=2585029 RepID=UPI00111A19C3|nr:Der GTPase-activating protein YihI [Testudinibacter sp. TR-2022]TNH05065.1 Der GTPase-activating protein YihI [Pasteurellaceae bacterium Phil31]TNH10371.1 Der GTPase-activating protein YihI [Testudinibacter sp. TR-2022]TNH10668.1 Der GTPase-activating protein YihI [Testudinibacter sp. TR-2022]TNH17210.1 Der GTPase-activating protein YihI [Testudinibacter sp. TR-2022]TNH20772.1 Der GTPase-activating protein YihI [Testudinibacter sp. TR-2022]
MARQKKTRKISDIMPVRRTDKAPPLANVKSKKGRKPTRYELDVQAREEKRKKKHKGLDAGSRHSAADKNSNKQSAVKADPRVGSRKKIPLMIEMVNKPEKGKVITPIKVESAVVKPKIDPALELEQLENNECLNELLDHLDEGKTLSAEDQQFVDDCLRRIEQLMQELGLNEEDEDENSEDALYRTFNTIDINKFR